MNRTLIACHRRTRETLSGRRSAMLPNLFCGVDVYPVSTIRPHFRLQGIRNPEKRSGRLCMVDHGNHTIASLSCMEFNWDILSRCMDIVFK